MAHSRVSEEGVNRVCRGAFKGNKLEMMMHPGASIGGHWLSETERLIVVTEQRATWRGLGQSQRKIDAAKR